MTEFVYEEFKRVIIRNIQKVTQKEFLKITIRPEEYQIAFWCNGMLIEPLEYEQHDVILEEAKKGIKYIDQIIFSKCTKKPDMLKDDNGLKLEVVNFNTLPFLMELTEWIKTQPIWEDEK